MMSVVALRRTAVRDGYSIYMDETLVVFNLTENGTIYGYQNMGVYFSF
jgi:hypothetical protein